MLFATSLHVYAAVNPLFVKTHEQILYEAQKIREYCHQKKYAKTGIKWS